MRVLRSLELLCATVLALVCLAAHGCAPPQEVLASYDSGQIKVTDLDQFLLSLPEGNRKVPDGTSHQEWMEVNLRRLAFERVLARTDEARQAAAGPDFEARQTWRRISNLVTALTQVMAEEASVDEELLATRVAELAKRSATQPVLRFRHIFFRIDRAGSPAEVEEIRELAEEVRSRALAGEDFAALATAHSQSSTAAKGGLVQNARPSDLDPVSAEALEALAEGEVSPVVQTASGLHLFKLERRLEPEPPSAAQLEESARQALLREAVSEGRRQLLEELRQRVGIETGSELWTVGGWRLEHAIVERLLPLVPGSSGEPEEHLVDHLLLADEARSRGLEGPQMNEELARMEKLDVLKAAFLVFRQAHCESLPEEQLRETWSAQSSAFVVPERVHLWLIFVPQGRQPFVTQRRMEEHVAALRAGASFADLAREISTGPSADQGGDLGVLQLREVARLGPPIMEALQHLETGKISDPVHCSERILSHDPMLLRGGFAVLQVTERFPEQQRSFEEARDDARAVHCRMHRAELDKQIMSEMLEGASFQVHRIPEPAELSP